MSTLGPKKWVAATVLVAMILLAYTFQGAFLSVEESGQGIVVKTYGLFPVANTSKVAEEQGFRNENPTIVSDFPFDLIYFNSSVPECCDSLFRWSFFSPQVSSLSTGGTIDGIRIVNREVLVELTSREVCGEQGRCIAIPDFWREEWRVFKIPIPAELLGFTEDESGDFEVQIGELRYICTPKETPAAVWQVRCQVGWTGWRAQ